MEASRGDQEPRSWTLRVLAPLAIVATAAVLIAVVAGSLSKSDSGSETSSSSTSTTAGKGCGADPPNPPADAAVQAGYYVIKVGETLETVTERTCVPGSELERLNPDLDPLELPVGACVNLDPKRPDACSHAG
ncbi:MAG: hypothetical protein ACJ75R_10290 [Solirubrobacterales bacterium]